MTKMGFLAFASLAVLAAVQDTSPHSDLSLSVVAVEPGVSCTILARIKLDPDWHCYWVNPGDSGMPTTFDIKVPKGYKAEEPSWSIPHRLISQGATAFGYENEALALVKIMTPRAGIKSNAVVEFSGTWLVCQQQCEMASQSVKLDLSKAPSMRERRGVPSSLESKFPLPDVGRMAESASMKDGKYRIHLSPTMTFDKGSIQFLPRDPGVTDHKEAKVEAVLAGHVMVLEPSPYSDKPAKHLTGLLVFKRDGFDQALRISLPIR